MLQFTLQSLSLTLPIFIAGVFFILALKLNFLASLNTPIDFGKKVGGKRIFGDNKTWRGVIIYAGFSLLVCLGLHQLRQYHPSVIHQLFNRSPILVGSIYSASYIAGELLNSFVKRQLNIPPGFTSKSQIQKVIDNIDGIAMVGFALIFLLGVPFRFVLMAAASGSIIHLITDRVMKKLNLK